MDLDGSRIFRCETFCRRTVCFEKKNLTLPFFLGKVSHIGKSGHGLRQWTVLDERLAGSPYGMLSWMANHKQQPAAIDIHF